VAVGKVKFIDPSEKEKRQKTSPDET